MNNFLLNANYITKTTFHSKVSLNSHIQIPHWAKTLIAIGEQFHFRTINESTHRKTIALCLPCINYAATLMGIGMLKSRSTRLIEETHRRRLNSLLGHWVSFEKTKKTEIGILEFCETTERYRIKLEKHGLWTVLNDNDWVWVRPIGREFNPNRRLNKHQITKIKAQNHSIRTFTDVLGFDLWKPVLENSGRIFSIFGNKTRLHQELTQPFYPKNSASLADILRPEGLAEYEQSFHCTVEANRAVLPATEGALVIIEAGRALPDQLAQSKHLNRILILSRNSNDYENCSSLIMENFSLRIVHDPEIDVRVPETIGILQYYHR